MVEQSSNSWAKSLNSLVISFFNDNLPQFVKKNETAHAPYWGVSFFDHKGIQVGLEVKMMCLILL